MYDNLTLYRLKTGELIVAAEIKVTDEFYEVNGPHSIVEEPARDGQQPRVMLQPAIPHDESALVELNKAVVVLRTKAPDNVQQGYKQALSNIIMPDTSVKKSNITDITAGLR